nr:uncharacterized protein LOC131276368 isoform X1 [Dasypus novemcinctus]
MDLEKSPQKANGKKLSPKQSCTDEDKDKATQQAWLEQGHLSWFTEWRAKCELRERAEKPLQGEKKEPKPSPSPGLWKTQVDLSCLRPEREGVGVSKRNSEESAAERKKGNRQMLFFIMNKIICKPDEDSQSKIYLSRLYQMYSTSLANMEFSRRLLQRMDWGAEGRGEWSARDLLDYLFPNGYHQCQVQTRGKRTKEKSPSGHQHQTWPHLNFLKCENPTVKKEDSIEKTRRHQAAIYHIHNFPKITSDTCAPAGKSKVPLTLEEVVLTHRVVEAKPVSRYWTNYVD